MVGLRWAVDCSAWLPSRQVQPPPPTHWLPLSLSLIPSQEWLTALAHIQPEELERISNFVFQKDAKLALVSHTAYYDYHLI
jgi:hypothetical protein